MKRLLTKQLHSNMVFIPFNRCTFFFRISSGLVNSKGALGTVVKTPIFLCSDLVDLTLSYADFEDLANMRELFELNPQIQRFNNIRIYQIRRNYTLHFFCGLQHVFSIWSNHFQRFF